MKLVKCFILILCINLLTSVAKADTKLALVKSSLLLDITSVNQQALVAVGERGHILRKEIEQPWQLITSPADITLTSVSTSFNNKVWAAGHQGTILMSADAGKNWQVNFKADTNSPFMDIVFFNEKHGIAIGAYGLFYRTLDGGKSWQKELHPSILLPDDQAYLAEVKAESDQLYKEEVAALQPHLNQVSLLNQNQLIMVGEFGLIATSTDKGRNWQRLDDIYVGSFFDVAAQSQVIVSGLRGHVFYTEPTQDVNQSTQWHPIELSEPVNINALIQLPDQTWRLFGNSQTYWKWSAGMEQAEPVAKLNSKAIVGAVVFNHNIWLVGDKGLEQIALPESPPIQ